MSWMGTWMGDWFADWFGVSESTPAVEIPRLFVDFEGTVEKALGTLGTGSVVDSMVATVATAYNQSSMTLGVAVSFGQGATVSGAGLGVTLAETGLTVTLTDDEFDTAETVAAAISGSAGMDLAVSVGNDGLGATSADGGL